MSKVLLEKEKRKEEDKTGVFHCEDSRLTGTLTYVCLCFCELLDSVSRSAALLLALFVIVKSPLPSRAVLYIFQGCITTLVHEGEA